MKLSSLSPRTLIAASLAIGLVTGVGVTAAVAARQPNMEEALRRLQDADYFLARATADKGGHRVKARRLISSAIYEVKQGIRYANY